MVTRGDLLQLNCAERTLTEGRDLLEARSVSHLRFFFPQYHIREQPDHLFNAESEGSVEEHIFETHTSYRSSKKSKVYGRPILAGGTLRKDWRL